MKIKSFKILISLIGFVAIILTANSSFAVVSIMDSKPETTVTLNNGGHVDEWTGLWELLPYNVERDTAVGATFCRQKHQALRFTPQTAVELNGTKTSTIVAHSVMHAYGPNDVPETYARATVENNIKNELESKLSDLGWGAAETGTDDMARYGVSQYRYNQVNVSGDVVAVSKPYSKTPKYVGQGKEIAQNTYLSYILSAGAYFNPITKFGLKQGNYAGTISDHASGENNAFLIQDAIWASSFNEAASDGINYKRVKPQLAVDLVKEAEAYEAYTSKLENYSAKFMDTNAKVIPNKENKTYSAGPFKIDYPDDTRFSYIQDIYLIDKSGNRIDTDSLKIVTTSGNPYPASQESFFLEFDKSVGDRFNKVNVRVEFAHLSLTYSEYERFIGTGEIAQLVGTIETTSDTHEYKDPEWHSTTYHQDGRVKKEGYYEHFYCTRYYLTGKYEERIIGTYDPQDLFDVISVKREWVEDYSTTYAERKKPHDEDKDIDLTTALGGFVWVDENSGKEDVANGLYDSTEKRVPNIIVKLYKADGTFLKETKTDKNGEYRFTELNALDDYYVTFTYNGQYYEPTTYTSPYDSKNGWGRGNWQKNSNATDVISEREAYNNKFAVIGSSPANYGDNKRTYTKMELLGYTLNENGDYVKNGNATIDEFGNLINANSSMTQYVTDSLMTAHTGLNTSYDKYIIPDIYLIDNEARVKNTYGSMYNKRETANKISIVFPDAYYINLGLHPRQEADVAVKKDVEKVTLEINDKVQNYTYDTLDSFKCNHCGHTGKNTDLVYTMDTKTYRWANRCPACGSTDIQANWDISVRLSDSYYNKDYSRELYKSDYIYKVSSYGTPEQYGRDKSDELQVYVTYKIRVSNQSLSIKTRIDELVDFFDTDYELVPERSYIEIEQGQNSGKYNIVLSDKSSCGPETNISGLNRTYIRGIGKDDSKGIYLTGGQSACFYVTFRVKKDTVGNEEWLRIDENIATGEIYEGKENIVELNGYSTMYEKGTVVPNIGDVGGKAAGIVDINSNPGNQTSKTDIRENDTDKAPKIRVVLNKDDEANRVIAGIVWDDERTQDVYYANIANGIMDKNESAINGVTVQLVELMDNGSEFVWREFGSDTTGRGTEGTGTGSGTKASETPIINAQVNGKNIISDYTFEGSTDGTYAFKSFIPGNYVVRFIYGDTVKTVAPSSLGGLNEKSYNGQDYKSTTYQKGIEQNKTYDWREGHSYVNGEEVLGELLTTVSTFKADASNNETVSLPNRSVAGWKAIDVNEQKGYLYDIVASSAKSNVSSAKDIESRRNTVNDYSDENVTNAVAEVLASHKEDYEVENRENLLKELMKNTSMRAETGLMDINFELENSDNGKYKIQNVNLGLEERPKASIELNKEVKNVKLTLADGSVLFDANGSAKNVLWSKNLVQLTMDEELMHGATIKIDYDITAKNVGEVDYKDNLFYYTGVVSQNAKAVTTTVDKVIDYVANNLQFNASENAAWSTLSKEDIKKQGLVNSRLSDKIDEYNTIIVTEGLSKELVPETYTNKVNHNAQSTISVPVSFSQLVTSENSTDDLSYRNIAEIVATSNTVGRRMDTSVVGNQDPLREPSEIDADKAQIVKILPPFGETPIYIIISIVTAVSIAIITGGIIFIKKKVLSK